MRKKDWLHLMAYGAVLIPTPFPELMPPALARESSGTVESCTDRPAGTEIRCLRQPIERLNVGYFRERAARFRELAALISDDTLGREMMELVAAYEARASQLEAPNDKSELRKLKRALRHPPAE
jgi:hypothetical protein